jgi:hypothetical protein
MFKKEIFVILLWLFVHSFVQAAEGNLLFIVGKDVKRTEYDIFSSNPVSLEYRKIIDYGVNPAWSPDRQKIAFIFLKALEDKMYGHQMALCVSNRDGSQNRRAKVKTFRGEVLDLGWSPDGQKIAMATGKWIVITTLDEEIMAYEGPSQIWQLGWLNDGQGIVFHTKSGISFLDVKSKEQTSTSLGGVFPKILPGTHKLLYMSRVEGVEKTANIIMRDLKRADEEVLVRNVLVPLPKKSVYCVSGDGKKIIFYRGGPEASKDEVVYGIYDVSTRSIKYHRNDGSIMEAVSHDGMKIAGVFKFGDKAGYGIWDLVTGKKSLIREIREGEIDKRVFGFSRLMDW